MCRKKLYQKKWTNDKHLCIDISICSIALTNSLRTYFMHRSALRHDVPGITTSTYPMDGDDVYFLCLRKKRSILCDTFVWIRVTTSINRHRVNVWRAGGTTLRRNRQPSRVGIFFYGAVKFRMNPFYSIIYGLILHEKKPAKCILLIVISVVVC